MCTYNLVLKDSLIEKAQSAFHSKKAITEWMQTQIERMLRQIAVSGSTAKRPVHKIVVSEKIKALSNVEPTTSRADYKDDILDILSEFYRCSANWENCY